MEGSHGPPLTKIYGIWFLFHYMGCFFLEYYSSSMTWDLILFIFLIFLKRQKEQLSHEDLSRRRRRRRKKAPSFLGHKSFQTSPQVWASLLIQEYQSLTKLNSTFESTLSYKKFCYTQKCSGIRVMIIVISFS